MAGPGTVCEVLPEEDRSCRKRRIATDSGQGQNDELGGALTSRRHVLTVYLVWLAVLAATYYGRPGLQVEAGSLFDLSGGLAIVAGVVINRPARKVPWLLLAAANLTFAVGQISFLVLTEVRGVKVPFPSIADGFYLATYPLYAAGMLIFIWSRTPDRDRRSLIDALTLTVGLALLSWIYLILPYVHEPQLSWLQKSVAIAYPLGGVLVLAMIARLIVPGTAWSRSVQLLTLGTVGLLVSDVWYGLEQLHGSFHAGSVVDLGWAVFYGAWGAAALHPSMSELTQPVARRPAVTSPIRLTVLMLASFIAPAVLFIQSFTGRNGDDSVIAVFSALLYLLVLSRLWEVAASHRRVLRRERAVRLAGPSLASAVSVTEVVTIIERAAVALFDPRSPREALLVVRDDNTLRRAAAADGNSPLLDRLAGLIESCVPLLTGSQPLFLPVARLGDRASVLLPGCDEMLLCPATLKDRRSGDPFIAVLAVFGGQRTLADLSATLEILAQQAALAVERVILSKEVIRRGSEAYFQTVVQDTSDAILIVGDDGIVRYATPSAASIFGDIIVSGVALQDLVRDGEQDELVRALGRMRQHAGRRSYHGDLRITRRDNVSVQVQVRCSDLRDEGTVGGMVLTLRDVTEQRQLEEELKHRAFHDALTGLPNRLLFQDRAARGLVATRRGGTTAGVLFVDLDDFKVVNDTMGHSVGDELLVAAGTRLASVVRDSDMAARLGGDEFAVLVEGVPDSAAVDAFAERIVTAFSEPFTLTAGSVLATATIGVATTEESADVDELLRHADLALYAAKAAGKRQWRRYQPILSAGMVRRRVMQAALETAVQNSEFSLVYQPIVDLVSGQVAGFESLVRWRHARWGMMQPSQFIELAEETGHIVPLGSWVLGQAAADVAQWVRRLARPAPLYVSVNVSARQFRDPGFVDGVRRVLAETGLAPSALMLELTESVLLRRDERIHHYLRELKAIGVRLAMDDFGTGYSSMSYLRELPFDVLKIDKSFIDGISTSEQGLALVEGINRIAETLHLSVIAEGIEAEAQRDLLVSMGCRYGQGYLLAMPVEADHAEALVQVGRSLVPELPRISA
jgi:diguanylate cyclase (GGDEF)-like protein/PAS domain S-box-containing protein